MKLVANNGLEACRHSPSINTGIKKEGRCTYLDACVAVIHVGLFGVFLMMFMAMLHVDLGVLLVMSMTDNDIRRVVGVL
jgi:hypothetical protein